MKNKLAAIFGIIFLLIGIILSVFFKQPHYYTFFSIGAFLILLTIYNSISKKSLFNKWKINQYFLFATIMIILSIILDKIGISLNYWTYKYNSIFDEILKYLFEWALAMTYIMISFLIGIKIFEKAKLNKKLSSVLSILIFVTATGLITEFFNHFSNSWIILKMPVTNFSINGYFIIFQTIGYWLMSLITLFIYKRIAKLK